MLTNQQHKLGLFFALSAFIMWGLAPIYFKQLIAIDAKEILVHRIIWSVLFLFLITLISKQANKVIAVFRQPRLLLMLLMSTALLGLNWGLFIWAVNNSHMLDASLGYYINPLINVVLGYLFLQERLRRRQGIAVCLALSGVIIQLIAFGSIPIIALTLACSFSLYGLIHKKTHVESLPGLMIEALLLLPAALAYWYLMPSSDTSNLMTNTLSTNSLLIGLGIITTLPLLCFTAAAKRLRYTTLGFIQYIGPSLMFILAVVLYDETIGFKDIVTFSCIWAGLTLFTWDSIRHSMKYKSL
ncbi:MAG: EamA family transporter RarD [Oleispira sp.]|nr:EamA family transporter RarD [Oleispira sp.]MBL4882489.1 EamA family transporter RarD [Oleispira sp.]